MTVGLRLVALCFLLVLLSGCQGPQPPASPTAEAAAASVTASADVLERGRYLLRIGDCRSCHTRRGGEPWAGGRAIPTPFGAIYSTNITPDEATGIGTWTAGDFWRALHHGKRPDGSYLYPAFPYDFFTRIRREDSDAMFAALQVLAPVPAEGRVPDLDFPWNQRWLLGMWRMLNFDAGSYKPDPDKSPEWNRGAYLVRGIAHCGACHTPRGALGGVNTGRSLAGALVPGQHWYAPNLHPGKGGELAGWTRQDIVNLLGRGRSRHGTVFGPMREVVSGSTQYLAPDDLGAIATYLLDQPAGHPAHVRQTLWPSPDQARALVRQGRDIYSEHCADCHGDEGHGKGVYPPLARNTTVSGHPVNAIRAVLLGGFGPVTRAHPRPYSMPPFAPQLNDVEVAAVVSYIRFAFAGKASPVSPEAVSRYRSTPAR